MWDKLIALPIVAKTAIGFLSVGVLFVVALTFALCKTAAMADEQSERSIKEHTGCEDCGACEKLGRCWRTLTTRGRTIPIPAGKRFDIVDPSGDKVILYGPRSIHIPLYDGEDEK